MTSKEFMDSFRNEFKKEKFHIIKEKFDEYYDFALCFEVKETKDWKYGIWFLFDEKQKEKVNSLQFFARHKDDLEKFKPSRSHYCREINIENSVKIEEWELASCIEMVKQIKTHPFLSADLFYKANGDEVFKGSKCWVEYKNNDKDDTYSIYLGEEEIEKFYGWKYRLFKKKK